MKVVSVVGARPQFIKLAPLIGAIHKHNALNSKLLIEHLVIHTGQHYDYEMNKIFFDELNIPEPDYNLEVGSGSHGWQTGEMLKRIEEVLLKEKPDIVMVYGDTNSTLAAALAATKLHITVAHIEAGLRSYNKNMPEEINRVLVDHVSSILFCPTETAVKNLQKEGFENVINNGKIIDENFNFSITNKLPLVINVGDVMYDALLMCLEIAETKSSTLSSYELSPKSYYLATIHRAENTDNKENLRNIFDALMEIGKDKPVIVPLHPRTRKVLESLNSSPSTSYSSLRIIDSVSYFDMLILEKNACKILTDSGGVQKEAYWFGVPCITLRDETEWVETLEGGWNVLVGCDPKRIVQAVHDACPTVKSDRFHGDGGAAERIVRFLVELSEAMRKKEVS